MPYKIKKDYGLNRTGGRSLFEIYADFLEYCRTPRKVSDAKARNGLRNDRGNPYVKNMFELELICATFIKLSSWSKKRTHMIQTTPKGVSYISALKYALSFLDTEISKSEFPILNEGS